MPRRSAGLLLYRLGVGERPTPERRPTEPTARRPLEVLLVHPGGPFWAHRDDGAWSIPKGETEGDEDPLAAAEREVAEELGRAAPPGDRHPLGEVVQRGGKRVMAWAVEVDAGFDAPAAASNTFEIEWPPRSGQVQSFPEVDRAQWFSLDDARRKILASQADLLDRLAWPVAGGGGGGGGGTSGGEPWAKPSKRSGRIER
ncbi:MAG: NUDIX domain-containing protein [Acidimicrobiales bacterium]